jgi:plasmid replication initiation protein
LHPGNTNTIHPFADEIPTHHVDQSLRELVFFAKWPVFALCPRAEKIDYLGWENKTAFRLFVLADNIEIGLATLKDSDVLIFAISELVRRFNNGLPLDQALQFQPTQLLRLIGRGAGGRQIKLLEDALQRLRSTTVRLMRQSKSKETYSSDSFNLLEDFYRPPTRSSDQWSIQLPAFIKKEIELRRFLKIPPAALQLSGLERRLYSWARAHAGGRGYETWEISLRDARTKAASIDRLSKFSAAINRVAGKNRLPGFNLEIKNTGPGEVLVFTRLAAMQVENTETNPVTISLNHHIWESEQPLPVIDLSNLGTES